MSEQPEQRAARRVGRSYTRARRHPWVLGKIGEFTLPLGPYTPAQLAIAGLGTFALIQTYGWWAPLGPIPLIGLGTLVWAARSAKVGGRTPQAALLGLIVAGLQPPAGRISGATAKDRRLVQITGGFHVTATVHATAQAPVQLHNGSAHRAHGPRSCTTLCAVHAGGRAHAAATPAGAEGRTQLTATPRLSPSVSVPDFCSGGARCGFRCAMSSTT